MYVKALKDGSSVVAVNKEGKLMGVRVGNVTRYINIEQDHSSTKICSANFIALTKYMTYIHIDEHTWIDMCVVIVVYAEQIMIKKKGNKKGL